MATPPPLAVLIDLDGTLVDSAPDIHAAVNRALTAVRHPPRSLDEVRGWIGNGIEPLLHRALTADPDGCAPAALLEPAKRHFQDAYRQLNGRLSRLYPGVSEGLERLRAAGCALACVTNKPAAFAEPLLTACAIADYFSMLVGGDTLAEKKPHPRPLLYAAARLGAGPDRSLLVGDSETDVKAARAAGMAVVCVSYGYNHGRDIRAAGPDAVVDSLSEPLW